jgi:hypothetical protein
MEYYNPIILTLTLRPVATNYNQFSSVFQIFANGGNLQPNFLESEATRTAVQS